MENISPKILLAEDDESIAFPLVKKLKDEGLSVTHAVNGKEGLEKALEEHPNLILLDLNMPIMDGMEMLKKLREDKWGKTAQVVIITNLDFNLKASEAFKLGVFEYLVKSNWNLADIVGKVKSKLENY